MKTKPKSAREEKHSAFWDTSGIVPLCCLQPQSAQARQVARSYGKYIVWWATSIEATSSVYRLVREGEMTIKESQKALARIDYLRQYWNEIQPTEEVRELAERLLGRHKLKSADALQLAAALVWCNNRTRGRHFIGADGALLAAAATEGFTILNL
jgi:predicted nucleic acid-binding protein